MKRRELTVGMTVEDKRGDTYVVIETDPWSNGGSSIYAWRERPVRVSGGSGVAVGKHSNRYGGDRPATWLPTVVQLTQLVPEGTRDASRQAYAREAARRQEMEDGRRRTALSIAEQLGLQPYQVEVDNYGKVKLPLATVEGLLTFVNREVSDPV